MTTLNRFKNLYLSYLISLTTLATSLCLTEAASAAWNYVKCIGVQNDAGPLKTASTSSWSHYVYGDWGNSSLTSGTLGNGGWMNYFRLTETNKETVKNQCKKDLPPNSTVYPMVQLSSIAYQWPIVDTSTTFYYLNNNKYTGAKADVPNPKEATSFINYQNLLALAEASFLVYLGIGLDSYNGLIQSGIISNGRGYEELKAKYKLVGSLNEAGISKATAVGLISNDRNYLIIAFRGTSSALDVGTDVQLMAQNVNNGNLISDFISQGYIFYETLKKTYPGAKIILTGHSLGGYIANIIAMKSGELARVFSSPANYIVNSKNIISNALFTNYVPLPNVINFASSGDPVVMLSGRHVSSEIFFPGTYNGLTNHSLGRLIDLIRAKTNPTNVYLNPDTILAPQDVDPIKLQVNYQGNFPAP